MRLFQGVTQRAVEKTRERVQDNKVKRTPKRAINQPTHNTDKQQETTTQTITQTNKYYREYKEHADEERLPYRSKRQLIPTDRTKRKRNTRRGTGAAEKKENRKETVKH